MLMIRRQIRPAVIFLLIFVVITGIVYPLVTTGIAQIFFPFRANGSIITAGGQPIGSELIGQPFDQPQYFWGRLSGTSDFPYNASASGGTNYSATNDKLIRQAQQRINALKNIDPNNTQPIPVDLVTASASGLDPHISVAAAQYQVNRVARTRGISPESVLKMVAQYTEKPTLGFLGESRVNVLKLNLALDERR
jgi:K+-transporting ATPase KdpC subunit